MAVLSSRSTSAGLFSLTFEGYVLNLCAQGFDDSSQFTVVGPYINIDYVWVQVSPDALELGDDQKVAHLEMLSRQRVNERRHGSVAGIHELAEKLLVPFHCRKRPRRTTGDRVLDESRKQRRALSSMMAIVDPPDVTTRLDERCDRHLQLSSCIGSFRKRGDSFLVSIREAGDLQ